jgi:hypothetical protein
MRLIIAGSRGFDDYALLESSVFTFLKELEDKHSPIEIISGTAGGADTLGEKFAKRLNLKLTRVPANWDLHGKAAGYKRNVKMAENADACICFWDGVSKGTQHMINIARKYDLSLKIVMYKS